VYPFYPLLPIQILNLIIHKIIFKLQIKDETQYDNKVVCKVTLFCTAYPSFKGINKVRKFY